MNELVNISVGNTEGNLNLTRRSLAYSQSNKQGMSHRVFQKFTPGLNLLHLHKSVFVFVVFFLCSCRVHVECSLSFSQGPKVYDLKYMYSHKTVAAIV